MSRLGTWLLIWVYMLPGAWIGLWTIQTTVDAMYFSAMALFMNFILGEN